MSDRPTPETDALASEHRGAVIWPYFARKLERERDEARSDLEFRRGLFQLQEQQLNDVRTERDKWKQKYIQQNKDLGCEMMDPGGTIWDYAKKLQDNNKDIQCKLVAERSLSNQLAGALMVTRWDSYTICKEAIFAWKEARNLQ